MSLDSIICFFCCVIDYMIIKVPDDLAFFELHDVEAENIKDKKE